VANAEIGSKHLQGAKGQEMRNKAASDQERADSHLAKAEHLNIFSKDSLLQIKRQAWTGGKAVASGFPEGNWLKAARQQALVAPTEMSASLWSGLLKAMRIGSVCITFFSLDKEHQAQRFYGEFEREWAVNEESPEDATKRT